MAGCGYVCPLCEGNGIDEAGNPCVYCNQEKRDWMDQVHGQCSCSDIGRNEEEEKNAEQ